MLILKNQFHTDGGLEKQAFAICEAFLKKQSFKKSSDTYHQFEYNNKSRAITILTTQAGKSPKNLNHSSLSFKNQNIHLHLLKKLPRFAPHFLQLIYYNRQVKSYLKKHPHHLILGLDKSTYQTHLRLGNGVHRFFLKQRLEYENILKKLLLFLDPRHLTILHFEKKAFLNPNLKKIIVNSNMVKKQICSLYPESALFKKIKVIHNGVEWKSLQKFFEDSFSQKACFLKSLKLPANAHHFLFVGHGFKRKGLDLLLKAFYLLKKEQNHQNPKVKNKTKNWHLSILGKDKKLKSYLKLTKKYHLQKHVSFFGKQTNTKIFYALADTFVLPSYYDPFANTTLEALAMGIFTITSAFNGGKEIINKKNGRILKRMDEKLLYQLLKEAFLYPKTFSSARKIRASIKHLEINQQLDKFLQELD